MTHTIIINPISENIWNTYCVETDGLDEAITSAIADYIEDTEGKRDILFITADNRVLTEQEVATYVADYLFLTLQPTKAKLKQHKQLRIIQ